MDCRGWGALYDEYAVFVDSKLCYLCTNPTMSFTLLAHKFYPAQVWNLELVLFELMCNGPALINTLLPGYGIPSWSFFELSREELHSGRFGDRSQQSLNDIGN